MHALFCNKIMVKQVENKVKARQQADKIAQKKANKIKQKIESKEKQPSTKEKKKSRGALQREKKRARKEAGDDDVGQENKVEMNPIAKKPKLDEINKSREKIPKMVKPKKKRKVDVDEEGLEEMIRSYKESFSPGTNKVLGGESKSDQPTKLSRELVVKRRWFE